MTFVRPPPTHTHPWLFPSYPLSFTHPSSIRNVRQSQAGQGLQEALLNLQNRQIHLTEVSVTLEWNPSCEPARPPSPSHPHPHPTDAKPHRHWSRTVATDCTLTAQLAVNSSIYIMVMSI